jgi:mono/diheme cytochrome c family protein
MTIHHVASLALAGACAATLAAAATKTESQVVAKGGLVFTRYCVSCHGTSGRGDGPLAGDLRVAVPDLTLLAANNSGRYPAERVQRIVQGEEHLRGHGSSDMPAWGDVFKKTRGIEAATPQEAIRNLVEYMRSIQRQQPK